jgi:hypothetical protein
MHVFQMASLIPNTPTYTALASLSIVVSLICACKQRKAGSGSSKRSSAAAAASNGDTTPTGDAGGASLRRSARSHRATDRFKSEVSFIL